MLYGDQFQFTILYKESFLSAALVFAFIGHYACCNGDTWSSELGVLSNTNPYLITNFKKVPKGTNGGVSALGIVASIAAGFSIGIAIVLTLPFFNTQMGLKDYFFVLLISTFAGLFGSLLDSVLGSTLQYSGWNKKISKVVSTPGPNVDHITGYNILSNHGVNMVSSIGCSLLIPIFGFALWNTL